MQTMMVNNTPAPMPEVSNSAPNINAERVSAPAPSTKSIAQSIKADSHAQKPHSIDEQKAILKESTEKFNQMSDELNLDVKFAYNDKIDQIYLNVVDKNTGRVIRKLPSEEAMKISESMKELVGNLLDKKG